MQSIKGCITALITPFNNDGLIMLVKKSCRNMTNIDIRNIRLTIWILFNPDAQRASSSLSFSNFRIVNMIDNKKQKGINFVNTLDSVKKE